MASAATEREKPSVGPVAAGDAGRGSVADAAGRLIGGAMAVTVAGAIAMAATVVLGLVLARALDPAAYGLTNVLMNEFLILTLVSGFGLTVGATAAAATVHDRGSQD